MPKIDPNYKYLIVMALFCVCFMYVKYMKQPAVRHRERKSEKIMNVDKLNKRDHFKRHQLVVFVASHVIAISILVIITAMKIDAVREEAITSTNMTSVIVFSVLAVLLSTFLAVAKHFVFEKKLPSKKAKNVQLMGVTTPKIFTNVKTHYATNALIWSTKMAAPFALSALLVVGAPLLIVGVEVAVSTYPLVTAISATEAQKNKTTAMNTIFLSIEQLHSENVGLMDGLKNSDNSIDLTSVVNFGLSQYAENAPSLDFNCLTIGVAKKQRQMLLTSIGDDVQKLLPVAGTMSLSDAKKAIFSADATTNDVSPAKWNNNSTINISQTQSFERMRMTIDAATMDAATAPSPSAPLCKFDEITSVFNKAINAFKAKSIEENELWSKLSVEKNKVANYPMSDVYTNIVGKVLLMNLFLLSVFLYSVEHLLRKYEYFLAQRILDDELGISKSLITTTSTSYLVIEINRYHDFQFLLRKVFFNGELSYVKDTTSILSNLNSAPERYGHPVAPDDVVYTVTEDAIERLGITRY